MKLFRAILLPCVILAFYSCKKENTKLASDSVYHKTIKEGYAIRVFARSGEINQPSIVNRFLDLDSAWISYLAQYLGYLDTIRVVDDEYAKLFESAHYKDYSYLFRGRDIRFTSRDTFMGYNNGEVFTKSINYKISTFKPVVFYEYLVSSTAGNYQFGYAGRREFFATADGDKLRIPWIVLVVHTSSTNRESHTIQNKPDFNFYQSIAANDTAVLREYSIIYEK